MPLLSAEAQIRLVTTRQGSNGRIIVEIAPANHSGPEPGIIYRANVKWQRLVAFGKGLNTTIREAILAGNVVPGQSYTPVMWELSDGSQIRVVMTADDCEMVAHIIAEVAAIASTPA